MREKGAQGPPLSKAPAPSAFGLGLLLQGLVHPIEGSTPGL